MKLSELIIKYCSEHNLSYRRFAEKCNLSNGYITLLINEINPKTGKPITPQIDSLKKIANGMGMSVNDILSTIDAMDIGINNSSTAKQRLHELIDTLPEKKAEYLLEIFLNLLDVKD